MGSTFWMKICRKKHTFETAFFGVSGKSGCFLRPAGFALSGNELDELETSQLFLTEVNANKPSSSKPISLA
jgi:hypothetical protein